MNNGTVKWFNAEKVLVSSKEKTEVTYSYTSRYSGEGYKTLEEGQKVDFDITEGQRGEQATNVVVLS